jgi:hypothetical protein
MKINQFFNPTWEKIIVTISIGLIFTGIGLINPGTSHKSPNCGSVVMPDGSVLQVSCPGETYKIVRAPLKMALDYEYISPVALSLNTTIWYILTCTVTFIAKKEDKK